MALLRMSRQVNAGIVILVVFGMLPQPHLQKATTCPGFANVFRQALPKLGALLDAMGEQGITGDLGEHATGLSELLDAIGTPSEQALRGPADRLRASIDGFRSMAQRWPDYTEDTAATDLQIAQQNLEGAVDGFHGAGCDLASTRASDDESQLEEWQTIASWSGTSGSKETETFTVPVNEWRLRWRTEPREGGGGLFAVNIYNADTGRLVTQASSEGAGNDTSFVRAPAGRFYITLGSSLAWQLWAERRR